MRLLLDTHVWLRAAEGPGHLNPRARDAIDDPANEVLFSVASAWEISIKVARGRLRLAGPAESYIPTKVEAADMSWLDISRRHVLHVATLPHHHRDPFDRLLIAQAQVERLTICTADPWFARYEVEVLPAT